MRRFPLLCKFGVEVHEVSDGYPSIPDVMIMGGVTLYPCVVRMVVACCIPSFVVIASCGKFVITRCDSQNCIVCLGLAKMGFCCWWNS